MKSPYHITYQDLINQAKARLEWMETSYPVKVTRGELKEWTAKHNIECQKALVRLLSKFKRVPQMDLFTEFEKMK